MMDRAPLVSELWRQPLTSRRSGSCPVSRSVDADGVNAGFGDETGETQIVIDLGSADRIACSPRCVERRARECEHEGACRHEGEKSRRRC